MVFNKLMVVAHPDDESIFGGAALLREKGWKVICLTNGDDTTRSKEFYNVLRKVDAIGEIWDYPDIFDGSFDAEQVKKDLMKAIGSQQIHRMVTHNRHGEYGHSQHKSLSKVLHDQGFNNLHVFHKSDEVLPFQLLQAKLELLTIYQSQMFVIEQLMSYIIYERIVPFYESK